MRVQLAAEPGAPGRPNEDFAAAAPGIAVLLDGAGTPPGRDTGCAHGVAWYARALGGLLLAGACDDALALREVLGRGIEQVSQLHAGTCDLRHPATPAATVIIIRKTEGDLEYLVLSDSVLLLQPWHGEPRAITDDRLAAIAAPRRPPPGGPPPGTPAYDAAREAYFSQLDDARNQPGGFWVAAADPAAAMQAITAAESASALSAVALLSDGASRLADRYHLATWAGICAILAEHGPAGLIRQVRAAEAADPAGRRWPRSKISDDAAVIWWQLSQD